MGKREVAIPSVDEVLRSEAGRAAAERFGRAATTGAIRSALAAYRSSVRSAPGAAPGQRADAVQAIGAAAALELAAADQPGLRRVINLTGTVLHTNLGRAVLAERAVEAALAAMRHPAALEYDLETGARGERDDAVRGLVRELTGAEDALVVNNNAAAVLLALNTLSLGRETIVSRGELIEIGGSFRMPEIMARAGARLVEVGTTNRTHARDYEAGIGPATALIMKVHTSNYVIEGFTREVPAAELARIAARHKLPLLDDLGSGTLVDLARHGLARERTVADAIRDGADLVTFSGDKLLGGPQAGFVIGRRELVAQCARNPLKRALRLDKLRLAALHATLLLYRDPDRLAATLPTLRLLTRPASEIEQQAMRVVAPLAARLGGEWTVSPAQCASQIGSGALPLATLASHGIAIRPSAAKASGARVAALAAAFRRLPVPVIARIEKGALVLDLRCLAPADEATLADELDRLDLPPDGDTLSPSP